ncbi:MAG: AMP-binding protein [Bacteroidetes bacterium]|nr:AMP-binding protein [Bacteroidota bacterium]
MAVPKLQSLTLVSIIERSVREHVERPALGYAGESLMSYREFGQQIEHLARFLQDQGIQHGDRVALLGENSPQWPIAYFAISTCGAVVVPILPDFHPSEISHILRHSDARVLFVSERFYHKVEDLHLGAFQCVILLDDFSIINPRTSKATLRRLIEEGSRELRKIRNVAMRLVGKLRVEVRPDDIAAIIYTSGTTGHSKGVVLLHRNIASNVLACAEIQDVHERDRFLSILPLAHVLECTIGMILAITQGASISYLRKPPTAAVMLPALEVVKPTVMLTVPLIIEKIFKARILPQIKSKVLLRMLYKLPAMRKRIHKAAGKKLMKTFGGQLKFYGIGGAKLAADVELFLREAGFPYAIGYGLTETSPLIAGCTPSLTKYRSTGPVVPGMQIRIADPDPKSGIGEIQTRGTSVMHGYYRDPERTAEAFTPDGWFRTGDLGTIDDDGYLYIKGRLKNMILGPSGENIYPEAIESIINQSDVVLESLVFDDQGTITARIHLDYEKLDEQFASEGLTESQSKERIVLLLEEIKRTTNEQVSVFSRLSRVIEQTEPFEKTPTQKIKRYLYAGQRGEE